MIFISGERIAYHILIIVFLLCGICFFFSSHNNTFNDSARQYTQLSIASGFSNHSLFSLSKETNNAHENKILIPSNTIEKLSSNHSKSINKTACFHVEHVLGISVAVSDIDWVKAENEGITFHPYALIGLIAVLVLIHLGCFLYIKSLKSEKAGFKSQLARKTRDMERQKEELQTQIEFTTIQNHKIEKQNQELRKHRQNLESLVKKRTKDLEEAKRKAEESDRLKSAFLANMSHEIRTPMNAIVGFSNILFEDNLSGKEQYELLRLINDNTNHLLKLIENLIDISKIEADELKFKYNPIDLNNLLEEIYFEYLDLNDLKNKGISLTVDKQEEEEDVYIYTDSWRLHQIISNLIDNAVKFTQSGKIVFGYRIRKTQSGKTLEFYVQDTGIGMSKEQQKHIYEIFRKMDHNHTSYSSGTGIGLSICKKLVEGLEGNIWVDSDAGKGSTFYFTLPYYEVKNFSF